jgi:enoyl-[acyl-carrier-protein] reductase (NADH)
VRYLLRARPRNVRVNAISADPFDPRRTPITGFTVMEDHTERNAPLRRTFVDDVGNAALYQWAARQQRHRAHPMVDAGTVFSA